jgi:hypothetical protein
MYKHLCKSSCETTITAGKINGGIGIDRAANKIMPRAIYAIMIPEAKSSIIPELNMVGHWYRLPGVFSVIRDAYPFAGRINSRDCRRICCAIVARFRLLFA